MLTSIYNWLASIGRQLLRAFGLGPKLPPLQRGVTVFPVADRAPLEDIWHQQWRIVKGRKGPTAYDTPDGLRFEVYQYDRFPDGSKHWGKYWKHSRVIVVLKPYEKNMALWAHECRHDVLGTEDHPPLWFHGSSLTLP